MTGATEDQVRASATLQHDLVDVSREVLTGLLITFRARLLDAYDRRDRLQLR